MSSYAPRHLGDVKARVGTDTVFEWVSHEPLVDSEGATLTVYLPSGPVTVALDVQPVEVVTALSVDRRTLTLDAAGTTVDGGMGRNGEAWLLTATQALPIRIVDSTGAMLTMAEALPRSVVIDASASVQMSRCEGVLPALTICAAVARDVRWTVDYAVRYGTGTGLALMAKRETGILQVVHQPFETGVAPQDVARYLRSIGQAPSSEQGWDIALSAGEEDLILYLRSELAERGLTEDDVPAPQSLRPAHLALTGAYILIATDTDTSTSLRERGYELARQALQRVWLDSDRDGEADEAPVQVGGSRARDFRAPSRSGTTRRFTVWGQH
jgi:hypothetical protein